MKAYRVALALVALMVLTLPAFGQDVSAITGVVKDADGGVLPGVSVTAKNVGTALTRSTTTSGDGRYLIGGLPPGTYQVTAMLQGFAEFADKITTRVGQTAPLNVVMKPAGVEQAITVEGTARPLIQTTESEVSNAISQELIATLPVAERNTITLALLTPGVSAAPYFDPTKSRDNFDGFSFGGGSASSTWTLVDGGDNNDGVVGSILQFYPQDSIQEFEVIASRFKAEYGHTDGGVVNMITKSGSNTLSGSAYWLHRDDNLNSKTFAEEDAGAEKAPFNQNVYGASLGGPIAKDTVFGFGNYDYTKRPKSTLTTTGGNVPEVDAQGAVPQDFDQTLAVAKVTANLGANNFATARYAYQDDSSLNVNLGVGDSVDHAGTGTNNYHAFLLKDSAVIGGDKLNEIFWQYNKFKNEIVSNAEGTEWQGQEVIIEGGATSLGYNINHPQVTEQEKHQFQDNFSFHASAGGDHDFKVGGEYIHVKVGGVFSTGQPFATYNYDSAADYESGGLASSATVFNGPLFDVGNSKNDLFSLYIQDDWKPRPNLTLNLGLRWDLENNDWTQRDRTFISADPLFFGGQPETDGNNFGPRAGFAYDVKNDATFVIRGGYGLYYQQIFWNSPIRLQFEEGLLSDSYAFSNNPGDGLPPVTFRPLDPFCPSSGTGQAGCIPYPAIPAPEAEAFVGSSGLSSADPRMKTPYSHQFTLGFSKQLPGNWALDADYLHTYSNNQIYRTRVAGRTSVNGLPTANMGRRATVNTQGGEIKYNGLLMGLRNNFKNLTTQMSYTYGRGEGHFARQTDRIVVDSDAGFDDNIGPNFSQRDHLFAASVTYSLPAEFQLGLVAKFQSGFAHNGFDSTLGDLDRDGSSTDTLADASLGSPDGNGQRGYFRGDGFSQVDLRVSKKFTFGGRYHPQIFFEVFNLFNARNEKPDDVITNINNSAFGTSASVAGQSRQAQISLRMDF